MDKRVRLFKVLANQRRLRILKILSKEKLIGVSVARKINLSPKSTSKHLIKLEELGLIKKEFQSRYTYYSLTNNKIIKNIDRFAKML